MVTRALLFVRSGELPQGVSDFERASFFQASHDYHQF